MKPAPTSTHPDFISLRERALEVRRALRVPLVVAPMFLVSTPDLVISACRAGVIGAIPTVNARPPELLEEWLKQIAAGLDVPSEQPWRVAPYALNVLTHESNRRLEHDLAMVEKYRPPVVVASVGPPDSVIEVAHRYGGFVLSDVVSVRHARRAAEAGADGLVLLCAGAGGQTGRLNPFAFVEAVRSFFGGLIAVAGGVTNGLQLRALQLLGADLGYSGTPFIATLESSAQPEYKQAIVAASTDDVWDTDAISGIPANVLRQTLDSLGLTPESRWVRQAPTQYDWSSIGWRPGLYSAGHGVEAVLSERSCRSIVDQFAQEYGANT